MSSHGTTSEPPTPPTTERGTGWLALSLVLLAALGAHLWLLGARWINPDEGAHLMDGVLLLDGLFPGVDYGARQPFYVFATAAVLEIFGIGFVPGRMLALICTLGGAAIIYAIARDLFDRKVALLSTALFLFMPFPLMLSVNAKTEPLAILLAAGAIWLAIRGMREGGRTAPFLAGAGALATLGFYVRESGLAILLALAVSLTWRLRRAPRRLVGAIASVAAGFLGIAVLMGGVHARHTSVGETLSDGNINPLVFVYNNVRVVTDAVRERVAERPEPTGGPSGAAPPNEPGLTEGAPVGESTDAPQQVSPPQALGVTAENIVQSVRFNAVLIVGALLYPLVLIVGRRRREPRDTEDPGFAALVLVAWACSMGAAYAFWAVRRGFFQAYFLEIIPPIFILTSAAIVHSSRGFVEGTGRFRMALGGALLVAALLVIPAALGSLPLNRPLYLVVPIAALAAIHLFDTSESGRWLAGLLGVAALTAVVLLGRGWLPDLVHPGLYALLLVGVLGLAFWAAKASWERTPGRTAFSAYALIVSAFFLTLGESIPGAGLRYDGVWGPGAVRAVAEEIRRISDPGDEVLSGAVIWELEAGRRPYMNISHPLGLMNELRSQVGPPIERGLAERPPAVVVLDGYTERTYFGAIPDLPALIEARYTRTLTVENDTRPRIEVYRLNH
jgi:4-amino-4-deoxy-L-arabinose transferase-like glycosyltransferase